jgi:hypothetical protein
MIKKENNIFEADAIPQGLTTTRTEKIYEIGKTLGITRSDIVATLKKKRWIQNCVVLLVAAAITVYSYAMFSKPARYVGISTQDFDTIGQLMYNAFGRFF